MEFTFKDLNLTEYEKFWLNKINEKICAYNSCRQNFTLDFKYLKGEIKKFKEQGFNDSKINKSLFFGHHITLIGLWHIDPQNKVFENINKIVACVKQKINEKAHFDNNNASNINVKDLHNDLKIPENDIEYALFLLKDFANFVDSKEDLQDSVSIDINDSNIIEAYLNFNNLDEIMENFFVHNNTTKDEPFNLFFQFIIDIIKTISKKEAIYLASIGGVVWLGLYIILNKIPFPNDLDSISLFGIALGLLIFLLLLFAFISILYYPLYNFLIDDKLRNQSIKEESFLWKYFCNIEVALILSLFFWDIGFYYLKSHFSILSMMVLIVIFVIYPILKNYILPKIFKNFINNILKKQWLENILIFFSDGIFLLIILLFLSLTFSIFINRNHIRINTAIFSFHVIKWFSLYFIIFTIVVIGMNTILGKYMIDKRKKDNKELYSEPLKTIVIGINIGLVTIIYILALFKVFNFNAFLDNTFKDTHIGSYYSTFVIKKSYFKKIKQKEFKNLIILNKSLKKFKNELKSKLNCKFKQKGSKNPFSCNFKIIGQSKKYYNAELLYKKSDIKKFKYSPLDIPKIKINNKNNVPDKSSLMIKLNKKKFENYLQALKVKKDIQNQLERSIINTSFPYPFSYCSVNGNSNSVLCKFYVLLNLGSNYVIRIKNDNYNYKDSSKKPPKYSIVTIPKKYVLGTKLYD